MALRHLKSIISEHQRLHAPKADAPASIDAKTAAVANFIVVGGHGQVEDRKSSRNGHGAEGSVL